MIRGDGNGEVRCARYCRRDRRWNPHGDGLIARLRVRLDLCLGVGESLCVGKCLSVDERLGVDHCRGYDDRLGGRDVVRSCRCDSHRLALQWCFRHLEAIGGDDRLSGAAAALC